MTYARASITLPRALLAVADRRAKELDRPRSWVVAEALRAYLGQDDTGPRQSGRVREPRVQNGAPIVPGLGPSRLAQLEADLALTPEERVAHAERTARATPSRGRGPAARLIVFDRYEDYLEWKRREDITP